MAHDLTGQRFNRLTVVDRAPNVGTYALWRCVCDCGKETTVRASSLKNGNTNS